MTRHPKTISYQKWIELKRYIHQVLTTGYSGDEQYSNDILAVMRNIEKETVDLEIARETDNEIPMCYQDGFVDGYAKAKEDLGYAPTGI